MGLRRHGREQDGRWGLPPQAAPAAHLPRHRCHGRDAARREGGARADSQDLAGVEGPGLQLDPQQLLRVLQRAAQGAGSEAHPRVGRQGGAGRLQPGPGGHAGQEHHRGRRAGQGRRDAGAAAGPGARRGQGPGDDRPPAGAGRRPSEGRGDRREGAGADAGPGRQPLAVGAGPARDRAGQATRAGGVRREGGGCPPAGPRAAYAGRAARPRRPGCAGSRPGLQGQAKGRRGRGRRSRRGRQRQPLYPPVGETPAESGAARGGDGR
mmetsp:Transcript_81771/g.213330  ORF Transcript_81771/g.213330 Transcript_81771/m.213330 type:complete len:266 (+) Transcript_81771:432-1229(+)